MLKRNLRSFSLFSLAEIFKLVIGLVLSRLLSLIPKYNIYQDQKYYFDHLQIEGFIIKKKDGYIHLISKSEDLNFLIRKNSSDYKVFNQVFEKKEYDPLVNLVTKYSHPSDVKTIIDAGANIGLTAIYLHQYFAEAEFYEIEPFESNCNLLKKNLENNGLNKVHILPNALWYDNSVLEIDENFRDGEEWSKAVKPLQGKSNNIVQGVTLEEILIQHKIKTIDILKIDIEGAEKHLFSDIENMQRILNRVKFIAIEFHEETCSEDHILKFLSVNNFYLKKVDETTIGINTSYFNGEINCYNALL